MAPAVALQAGRWPRAAHHQGSPPPSCPPPLQPNPASISTSISPTCVPVSSITSTPIPPHPPSSPPPPPQSHFLSTHLHVYLQHPLPLFHLHLHLHLDPTTSTSTPASCCGCTKFLQTSPSSALAEVPSLVLLVLPPSPGPPTRHTTTMPGQDLATTDPTKPHSQADPHHPDPQHTPQHWDHHQWDMKLFPPLDTSPGMDTAPPQAPHWAPFMCL